ncbi:MAG: GNAT family N-acetyltransferase [Gammaproteobacteria bacterium]|jgi:GNAT superfamily N-acetyltransferase
MNFNFRLANSEDIPAIKGLMEQSITELLGNYLNEEELEASFESMGLDGQLILDKTYFLIDFEGILVGCGGWSNRKTLFGGNHTPNRSNDFLNPNNDSAKIRAMYTHPDWARKGIGTLILELAEKEASNAGFKRCELMATLSGIYLYKNRGYKIDEEIYYRSKKGNSVKMFKMTKFL